MPTEPSNPDHLVGKFIVGMVATFGIWVACLTALEIARVEIDRGFLGQISTMAVTALGILGLGLRNEIRGRATRLQLDKTDEKIDANTELTAKIQTAVAPETKG